ncbi:hypothetical protein GCM10012275_42810 [Longimycelium tulufanense]|uniref:Uncharacterized protein n=2 Tax=Longimycelium tulufanense TaxID=907463 RepID=A0A8J3CHJ7_9PSEU|nr:hypothetical protein GCM10012275_42810 [Longimycelium tulufanense]
MESLDEVIQTATIGELECDCPFDRDGTHPVGAWMTCSTHRAAARVVHANTVLRAEALLAV